MFHVCKLVHADLSEYNILYHIPSLSTPRDATTTSEAASEDPSTHTTSTSGEETRLGELWIIDVSQSVEHDHPSAFDFLRNDVKNVEDFFARKGISTLGLRRTFEFVTREKVTQPRGEGAGEESDEEALKRWIEEREAQGAEADADEDTNGQEDGNREGGDGEEDGGERKERRDEEHEDAVFMKSYIPRNLNEVYDPERDVEKVARGEAKNLIYADTIGVIAPAGEDTGEKKKGVKLEGGETSESEEEGDAGDESGSDGEEGEEGEKGFVERKPKGHKFEDKDAKKASFSGLSLFRMCALTTLTAGAEEGSEGGGQREEEKQDAEGREEETDEKVSEVGLICPAHPTSTTCIIYLASIGSTIGPTARTRSYQHHA